MPLSIDKGQLGMSASEKLQLLKKQLLEKVNKDTAIYQMSYGQKALYFLYVNSPDCPAYNVSFTARIHSTVDSTALRKAFQKLVNRHEALRTNYRIEEGKPVQVVNGYSEVDFDIADVKDLSDVEIKQAVIDASEKPFDLENGSVLRVRLFKKDENDHILLVNVHHISNDGRSIEIMLEDLQSLYLSELAGEPSRLLNLPKQYHDFCSAQEEFIDSEKAMKQLDYWKNELADLNAELDLPFDKQRPPIQTYNGKTVYFEIDKELSSRISAASKASGATMFAYLLAAYMTFLKLHSDSDEIVTGIPASGRSFTGFENVIGYFINPVAIRINIDDEMSFDDVLTIVRRKILNAVDNQDYPFQLLVDEIMHSRDASRSPVFQTFFGLQKIQTDAQLQELIVPGNNNVEIEFGGLKLSPYTIPQQQGQFDITAEFSEGKEKFSGAFKYNADLFDKDTVGQMSKRFLSVLRQIAEDGSRILGDINLISEEEKSLLLHEWNDTSTEFHDNDFADEQFLNASENFPGHTALSFEGRSISYKSLAEQALQFAAYLTASGFGKGDLAAICVERSPEMVVSILAVLMSGGAYIPVDPFYPEERIRFMLEDSKAKVVLTQKKFSSFMSAEDKIILTDELSSLTAGDYDKTKIAGRSQDDPAYVIYTSGTTGNPKGVVVSHRALANHMAWMKKVAEFTENDSVLQKTPFSFDASVWEFFLPLLNGGKLVMAAPDGHMDMHYLTETVKKESITHIQFVPSLLRLFIDEAGVGECKSLKFIFSGGEALTGDLRDKVFGKLNVRLINLYGPTEATIDSTYHECLKDEKLNNVPIGQPIHNIRAYVVNNAGKLTPPGMPGELLLGGAGIALGYLNNPQLTSEKFIDNKFDANPGKLYRTGDKVRYNKLGQLEYLGRIDHQVKFRGYRIELGEIETVIKKSRAITEAYADVRTDNKGKQTLVAYIAVKDRSETIINELTALLRRSVPEYMVPSKFVFIDEFPKLPNGKIDKKRLPDPEPGEIKQSTSGVAQSDIEKTLSSIWKEVLGIDNIGVDDNFFELGGDSIISIQIISRAAREGLKITPRQMFTHQTIAELAREVGEGSAKASTMSPMGDTVLTPIQIRFLQSQFKDHSHFNHSLLLDVSKETDASVLSQALNACIEHHDALRLRVNDNLTGHIPDAFARVEVIEFDISDESNDGAQKIIEEERKRLNKMLNISGGELVNAALFRMPGNTDKLLINIHHICIDGVSWRILLEDLANAYARISDDESAVFGQKGTSFREWAQMLKEHSRSEEAKAAGKSWDHLSGFQNVAFKEFSGRLENKYSTADTVSVRIDEDDTALLLGEAHKSFNTKINDLLISAVAIAMSKFTDSEEIVIDLEGHGRADMFENADTSGTVGWFTSLYPAGFRIFDNSDTEAVIREVKKELNRYANIEISYAVNRYHGEKNSVAEIDSPVVFNYLGQFRSDLPGGWKMNKDSLRLEADPDAVRQHAIELNSMIIDSRLELNIEYSNALFERSSMEKFAEIFKAELKNVLQTCMSQSDEKLSAEDFEASGLSQHELDELLGG